LWQGSSPDTILQNMQSFAGITDLRMFILGMNPRRAAQAGIILFPERRSVKRACMRHSNPLPRGLWCAMICKCAVRRN